MKDSDLNVCGKNRQADEKLGYHGKQSDLTLVLLTLRPPSKIS
jgi:hypothetical protein